MGTLNPDLLSKDMDAVLNDAVQLRSEFRHTSIQPELLLLALMRRPNTAAARLFKVFADQRGLDVEKLERQVRLAIQNRRDQNGNLDFIARGNKKVPLSRQVIILLDEALSVANAAHEVRIDTAIYVCWSYRGSFYRIKTSFIVAPTFWKCFCLRNFIARNGWFS